MCTQMDIPRTADYIMITYLENNKRVELDPTVDTRTQNLRSYWLCSYC